MFTNETNSENAFIKHINQLNNVFCLRFFFSKSQWNLQQGATTLTTLQVRKALNKQTTTPHILIDEQSFSYCYFIIVGTSHADSWTYNITDTLFFSLHFLARFPPQMAVYYNKAMGWFVLLSTVLYQFPQLCFVYVDCHFSLCAIQLSSFSGLNAPLAYFDSLHELSNNIQLYTRLIMLMNTYLKRRPCH